MRNYLRLVIDDDDDAAAGDTEMPALQCVCVLTFLFLKPVNSFETRVRDAGITYKPQPHSLVARLDLRWKLVTTVSGQHLRVAVAAVAYFNLVVVALVSGLLDVELITKF